MKFKALSTIILWHEGQMKVFNPSDKEPGDLPEDTIQPYIDGSMAKEVKAKKGKKGAVDDDAALADDAQAPADSTAPAAGADAPVLDAPPA